MLFFDFYKHFGQNVEMIGHVSKEPCIQKIPNDAHLAILWQLTHNVQLNSMDNGSETTHDASV